MTDQDVIVFGILASIILGALIATWLGLPKEFRAQLALRFGTIGGLLIAAFVAVARLIAAIFSAKE